MTREGTGTPSGAPPGPATGTTTVPATAAETSPDTPWPLRLLSAKLKAHIERAPAAWVEGQVIELTRRASMSYITLRDVDSEVSLSLSVYGSVMDRLASPPERGSRVVARLKPDFWVKTGRLSMQTTDIRPVGIGDLLARIERLRQALAAEGLFAAASKKPLPLLPHRIGLITGRDSDAMKDVMRNAALRWPAVEFEVREVAVQGVNSVAQVRAALGELDADERVDVIIIARGGGALEDLLPFSDESLVRAVALAATPVVSAIGHEADRPLLDDVADLRASTPTDAAKRVVPDVAEELGRIGQARAALERAIRNLVHREAESLAVLRSRPSLAKPEGMIEVREADLERLRSRTHRSTTTTVEREADAIGHLRDRVRSLSPQKTLDRGYAVVQQTDGHVVRSPTEVAPGETLRVRVADGQFDAVTGAGTASVTGEGTGAVPAPINTSITASVTGHPAEQTTQGEQHDGQ
ncbi:exodeoxyribonuclease VII large subunit [uncultured Arthrobacter sp.]|uniref:exodeoxyribonuclease VII large subunit n=1 Tax=uncultured Arthrobacter sp. TaxID=114050 RepID=UPI002630A666|nr:exodeoxyribonuclease VII large subunit [uncultured Arthrobacter sp.]